MSDNIFIKTYILAWLCISADIKIFQTKKQIVKSSRQVSWKNPGFAKTFFDMIPKCILAF